MKKWIIFSFLILSPPILLYLFSKLSLEMFISFSSVFLKLVILTYAVWLSTVFFTILLSIKRKQRLLFYSLLFAAFTSLASSLFFGLPYSTSLSFALAFSLNTLYVYLNTNKRLKIFAQFKPKEIFAPIFKNSFLIFTLLLTLINFFTAVDYINNKREILTTSSFLKLTRPFLPVINRQVSNQVEDFIAQKLGKEADVKTRQQLAQLLIKELLEAMSEGTIRQKLGFRPDVIPADKIKVFPDGSIDIEPALVEAAPKIVKQLNEFLGEYKAWLPLIILALTFFTLLPVMWTFDLLSIFLLPALFFVAFKLSLVRKVKAVEEVEKVV